MRVELEKGIQRDARFDTREHYTNFYFRDFSELLSCVRGDYFAGYASELIG